LELDLLELDLDLDDLELDLDLDDLELDLDLDELDFDLDELELLLFETDTLLLYSLIDYLSCLLVIL